MTNKIMREGADSVVPVTSRTAATNESHPRHTPGPWKVRATSKGPYVVFGDAVIGDAAICKVLKVAGRGCVIAREREADYNAILIATAPDLLAALKVAADEVGRYGHGSIAVRLREVIAKAEGR